jgi:hypothetical protein
MIEILIIASVVFVLFRTRVTRRGTATQQITTITINLTKHSAFQHVRKVSRRSGRVSTTAGIVTRRNRRR